MFACAAYKMSERIFLKDNQQFFRQDMLKKIRRKQRRTRDILHASLVATRRFAWEDMHASLTPDNYACHLFNFITLISMHASQIFS